MKTYEIQPFGNYIIIVSKREILTKYGAITHGNILNAIKESLNELKTPISGGKELIEPVATGIMEFDTNNIAIAVILGVLNSDEHCRAALSAKRLNPMLYALERLYDSAENQTNKRLIQMQIDFINSILQSNLSDNPGKNYHNDYKMIEDISDGEFVFAGNMCVKNEAIAGKTPYYVAPKVGLNDMVHFVSELDLNGLVDKGVKVYVRYNSILVDVSCMRPFWKSKMIRILENERFRDVDSGSRFQNVSEQEILEQVGGWTKWPQL